MIQVILTQVISEAKDTPVTSLLGETARLPAKGEPFRMLSTPTEKGDEIRLVYTSPVQEMVRQDPPDPELDPFFEFRTERSLYHLHILDMDVEGSA